VKVLTKGISAIALAAMTLSVVAPAVAGDRHHDHDKTTATVNTSQSNGGQLVIGDGENNAAINAYAFASANGNIGANDASGNANQQSNTTYIDYATTLNEVSVDTDQHNGHNLVIGSGGEETITKSKDRDHDKTTTTETEEFQTAYIGGHAFSSATGNIGVNVAAGNLNQQSNVAVILSKDNLSKVTVHTDQHTGGSVYLFDGLNESDIGDNAFQSASGNIGANVASGNANQQSNTLVVNTSK